MKVKNLILRGGRQNACLEGEQIRRPDIEMKTYLPKKSGLDISIEYAVV